MTKTKKLTVNHIAKIMNVSRATVSRALNGSPGVGEELKKKILDFARENGHSITNSISSRLNSIKTKIIGLVFGDVRNPFYADLTFHVQQELNKYGYTVMIFNSEYHIEKELEFIKIAYESNLAGIILFTAQTGMSNIREQAGNIPIIFVNRSLDFINYDSVTIDNFKAGYIAAMHLIELGHKRIGFISGQSTSSSSLQRVDGFKQAMKNCFLPIDERDLMIGDLTLNTGYKLAGQFFRKKSRPSALILGNDMTALGFLDWCKSHNISIPEELSIVSFDDILFSRLQGIELTTVSQHVEDMGKKAAKLIVDRINNPNLPHKRIILEPTLISRKTVSPYLV